MKKAILGNRDIEMSLLCLRSTPMDHVIPSPGELPFNWKLVSYLPTKFTNKNARKEEIQEHLLHRQLLQEKTTRPTCKGSIQPQHRATGESTGQGSGPPAIVRQACTEPRPYIIETPTGQVLRRNRSHLKEDVSNSNKTLTSLHNTSTPHTEPPPLIFQTHILQKNPTYTLTSSRHLK